VTEVLSLPASTSLLSEFNTLAPGRRKTQDGTKGDTAHAQRVSDHNLDETGNTGSHSDTDNVNEVHARDVDSRGPWPTGWSMMRIVLLVVARCVSGAETRLLYIIFDGWIWEASNGWRKRRYDGADQHHEHAHFSFRYGSGSGPANPENITAPWGILAARQAELEADMALTADDKKWMSAEIAAAAKAQALASAKQVWATTWQHPVDKKPRTAQDMLQYAPSAGQIVNLGSQLALVSAAVSQLAGKDLVDEQAIVAGILAGLTPEQAGQLPEATAQRVVELLTARLAA